MEISDWRKRIDGIDARLVKLLNERMRYAAKVHRLKQRKHLPAYQPEREREILARVQRLNRGPLANEALKRLFKVILRELRASVQRAAKNKKGSKRRGKRAQPHLDRERRRAYSGGG